MPFTHDRFNAEALTQWSRYKSAWGTWLSPQETINNAWLLYSTLLRPSDEKSDSGLWLDFQLLGDTKIRTDPTLLANFGNTEATGLQGVDEENAVASAVALLLKAKSDDGSPLASREGSARDAMRGGVILSEAGWSTMLNDAFMLAGIHEKKDFHFVGEFPSDPLQPNGTMIRFSEFRSARGGRGVKLHRAIFEAWSTDASGRHRSFDEAKSEVARRAWKDFFNEYPELVWRGSSPRVFARELLGLMAFGYEPHFSEHGLFFVCTSAPLATNATFSDYLDMLDSVGFKDNRSRVTRAISTFLYGDASALATVTS